MKKSELKEMIKSAMLDEAKKSIKEGEDVGLLSQEDIDMLESKNFNIQPIRAGANDPDPSGDLRFVAKWTLKDGTARANWPFLERLLLSKNIPFTDETWGGDGRSKKEWQVKSQYIEDNLSYPEHDFHGFNEAKKSIKEGEDVGLLSQEDIDMLESKNFNIQPIRAGANDPDPSGDLRFVAKWTLKDGTARANWPFLERLLLSKNIPFTDETWGGDGRSKKEWQVKSQYIEDNLSYPEHDFHGFNEAKDADVEDEDIDVDIEKDEEIDDKETDIEIETSMPGESESEEVIQGLLMKAQEEATKLGDEKLTDQIGNTITYFTRAHIARVDESGVNEEEDLSESIRFKKLAGIIK